MRQNNQAGIDLIKHFEGLRLHTYRCSAGILTIGYGCTNPKYAIIGNTITEQQAEQLLRNDLVNAQRSVARLISVPLTDNQYAALVSFVFNLGGGALQRSTLRQRINRGDYNVANEFGKWCYAGGKKLKGLQLRRQAEADLWNAQPRVASPSLAFYKWPDIPEQQN